VKSIWFLILYIIYVSHEDCFLITIYLSVCGVIINFNAFPSLPSVHKFGSLGGGEEKGLVLRWLILDSSSTPNRPFYVYFVFCAKIANTPNTRRLRLRICGGILRNKGERGKSTRPSSLVRIYNNYTQLRSNQPRKSLYTEK
jgi:hypothetical protein